MSRTPRGRRAKKQIFIVTEGESEERYFSRFRQLYRCTGVKIKRINPCGAQIIHNANRFFRANGPQSKNSKNVIVIDKDALTEDEFNSVLISAEKYNISVIFSNISFEVWLLAHFQAIHSGTISLTQLKLYLTRHLGQEYKKGDVGQINKILENYYNAVDNTEGIAKISYTEQCTNVRELCRDMIEE